nr:fatty acid-binding protein, intestinal-like isoform X2 [Geotrypetes seraphini]
MKITIKQNGNKFNLTESSTFCTIVINFTLGVQFDYSLADGTEVEGTWNLEKDKMVGVFTRKDNGKVLNTTREIVGGELIQSLCYEGTKAKMIFKKE